MKKTGIYRPCDHCGKEIYVTKYKLEHNKNSFCGKECRINFTIGQKRQPCSEETKKKISNSLKGNIVSEETRKKLSVMFKGRESYIRTPKTIEKLKATIKKNGGRVGERNPGWKGGISYIKAICDNCGKLHTQRMCNYKNSNKHFCSIECKSEWGSKYYVGEKAANFKNAAIDVECAQCGKHFNMYKSRIERANNNFCSNECDNIFRKEQGLYSLEKNPAWLGGLSFEPYTPEWNEDLRVKIRTRDNFMCQICGNEGRAVHHINYNKEDSYEDNLITLCESCHGKTNHNREHWIEYFKKEESLCQ